jgi:3',5'-cyclic AMP phosphodiesterase CpdA
VTRFVVAHLSDCHIGAHPQAPGRLRRALEHVGRCDPPPDVLLLSGDLADHGTDEEYAQLVEMLAEGAAGAVPVVTVPGNHDVRNGFARHLRPPGTDPDRPLDVVRDVGEVRLVALDSLVTAPPGARIDHGELSDESLSLLDDALADGRPTFVALHHPPAPVHVALMDPIRLAGAERLEAVLRRHPRVLAVLVGHAHTAAATTFAGVPVLVGGGLVSTVPTDAEDLPVLDLDQPPTIAFHLLQDGHLVTHWRVVPPDLD